MCYSSFNRRISLFLTSICLAGLSFSFVEVNFSTAAPVQLAQAKKRKVTFRPRKGQPAPKTTLGGGRRHRGVCSQDVTNSPTDAQPEHMKVLVPAETAATTMAEQPTLLVQLPKTSAVAVEVTLLDAEGIGFYQKSVSLEDTETPGVLRLELTSEEAKLEKDKDYSWMVTLVCSEQGAQPEDPFAIGSIRRVEVEPDLTQKLATTADPLERAALYAESGIWYEAIAELDALRREKPEDRAIASAWNDLLASAGLDSLLVTASN